jgi:ABC-type cobalamin/Fe3+-siderophores transport systems, ATPase components
MSYSKIKEIKTRLWDKYDVSIIANEDVNIIVGINGSGKTTLLNEIYKLALENLKEKNQVIFVPSIDNIAMRDKRKTSNALTQDLEFYMFDMKTGPSMMYYRMSMIDASAEKQAEMKARIEDFRSVINGLFQETEKHIEIEGNKFNIVSKGQILPIDALSSGEKQILLIMLRVFLLEGKESYVLLDEPENSLDISWQYKLIDTLTKLNPNAQFFITTHSPSIFGAGWGDKIIYMEDVTTPVK